MSYSVPSGETVSLNPEAGSGQNVLLVVEGADILASLSRTHASDGNLIQDGDRAMVGQPPGSELLAYGGGDTDATVRVFPQGVNPSLEAGDNLKVSYQQRSQMEISGDVNADVSDRQGRNLGKVRLMESGGTLIDPATGDVSAEQPREIAEWSAGPLDVAPSGPSQWDVIQSGGGQVNALAQAIRDPIATTHVGQLTYSAGALQKVSETQMRVDLENDNVSRSDSAFVDGDPIDAGATESFSLSAPASESLSGLLVVQSSYDVEVEWRNPGGATTITETVATGVASGEQTTIDLPARSPECNVLVTETGGGMVPFSVTLHLR